MTTRLVLSSLLLVFSGLSVAEDAPAGPDMAALAQMMSPGAQLYMLRGCHACHGIQGEGVVPKHGPRLAGLPVDYMVRQLMHFQNGVRGDSLDDIYGRQMQLAANSLSPIHMQLIAQHMAGFKAGPPTETRLDGDARKGAQIYQAQCQECHGEGGVGNVVLQGTPLAGQIDVYLAQQLRNFKSGLRGAHEDDLYGLQMTAGVAGLQTEQDIADVSLYLATLGALAEEAPDTPEAVVQAFYRRLDSRDKDAIYDLLDPDVVFHFPDRDVYGPAGYWAYVSQVGLLIPDYLHVLDGVELNGDVVEVKSISISGTLANGETLTLPGSARYRVVDGKIIEAWVS